MPRECVLGRMIGSRMDACELLGLGDRGDRVKAVSSG